jgi:excisionase family DNA binding protein
MNTSSDQTMTNGSDPVTTLHRRGPALVCKKDIAKELSVSPRTIDNWVRKKRIPAHRFSSRLIRFDPRKVRDALDKYEVCEVGRREQ